MPTGARPGENATGSRFYLPISDCPIPLKAGQRVALDGVVEPFRQAFLWDRTQVRILQEGLSFLARSVTNLSEHARELKGRLVSVEGLIDRCPADRHLKIDFLARKTFANVYVQTPTNAPPVRFKEGDFVRVKCVHGAQFDQDGGLRHLGLWVVRPEDIEVIGSLATDLASPSRPRQSRPSWKRCLSRDNRSASRASYAAKRSDMRSPFGTPPARSPSKAGKRCLCV